MNWQLIQNVNCPFGELLLVVFLNDKNQKDCCFACRWVNGYMTFGETPEEAINGKGENILYEHLVDQDPQTCPIYWRLFVWP